MFTPEVKLLTRTRDRDGIPAAVRLAPLVVAAEMSGALPAAVERSPRGARSPSNRYRVAAAPEAVEVTASFGVSEALTSIVKHAHAAGCGARSHTAPGNC